MKKKVLIFSILLLLAINLISFTQAGNVTQAYQCLKDKVHGKCADLTLEENIFSLLAIGECKAEVVDAAQNDECWASGSSGNCNVKTTAQAILALEETTFDTTKTADWLLTQKKASSGITWYLQVESNDATSCTIDFDGGTYTFDLGEDKKISSGSGQCFTPAQDNYWLQISDSCLEKEFRTSCNTQSFLTNLIFQKQGSDIFFISEKTNTVNNLGATTSEQVNSFCFTKEGNCDYEGSLWAAFALTFLEREQDVKLFLPYLVTNAEDNKEFLPESFLYYITARTEYKTQLLSKQISSKYWQGNPGNNKFYDTAVALFSLVGENPTQKENAKKWLFSSGVQDNKGCWEGNVKNTAFLLHVVGADEIPKLCNDGVCVECRYDLDCSTDGSRICSDDGECIIPKECTRDIDCNQTIGQRCSSLGICIGGSTTCTNSSQCLTGYNCVNSACVRSGGSGKLDCVDEGFSCRDSISCERDGGEVLDSDDYECTVPLKCCTVDRQEKTCNELRGVVCNSNQNCVGGSSSSDYSDYETGESCCIGNGASCQDEIISSQCEGAGGACRVADSCLSGETSTSKECENPFFVCCELSTPSDGGETEERNLLWVWILLALIVLSLIGIIFRDKLRIFLMRFKGGSKERRPFGIGPRFPPPGTMGIPIRRPIPRRILPPQPPRPQPRPQPPMRRPTPPPSTQRKTEPPKKPEKKDSDLDEVLKKLKDIGGK